MRYAVVDTGGWLADRKVLLSPIAFRGMDWEHKRIASALTKDKVEKSPDIDTDKPVSRQHETEYFDYYGYGPYLGRGLPLGRVPQSLSRARAGPESRGARARSAL